ncbi:MAG: endonuclease III [Verrucomicrobia bacterium]|nr:endonuclease III [Verrucomicrobiota bacterium]
MKHRRSAQAQLKAFVRRIETVLRKEYGVPVVAPARTLLDALVETILSQNTTDTNSSRAFKALRRRFPRWSNVLAAPLSDIVAAVRCAGLANTKAPRIKTILARLKEEHGQISLKHMGKMNNATAMEYLLSLPGVGPKTAACTLLFGMGRDIFPVDTHIHRLCRRLGIVSRFASAERTQDEMAALVPKGRALSLHVNLIRHGRRVCKAQRPQCGGCVLAGMCDSVSALNVTGGRGASGQRATKVG